MNKSLEEISKSMIDRYSTRYNDLGYDVKTLGWGSNEQQEYRFQQTLAHPLMHQGSQTILDIGCGFGDYAKFLVKENIEFNKYFGRDINPDLIGEAKSLWENSDKVDFDVLDITKKNDEGQIADVGVMLGVLNLNFHENYDNYEYSFNIIKNAFKHVNKLLIVDFLSSHIDSGFPKEDFVFYHEPTKMMEFALSISKNVTLKHDYQPIPQKEFMLFIHK